MKGFMPGSTMPSSRYNGRIAERDTRDWRERRDEQRFKVRSSRFSELRTLKVTRWLLPDTMLPPISPVPPFPLVAHRSRLSLHAPRTDAWPLRWGFARQYTKVSLRGE